MSAVSVVLVVCHAFAQISMPCSAQLNGSFVSKPEYVSVPLGIIQNHDYVSPQDTASQMHVSLPTDCAFCHSACRAGRLGHWPGKHAAAVAVGFLV